MNKKEKLLKKYVQIYRPILEKEKKKKNKDGFAFDKNWDIAA